MTLVEASAIYNATPVTPERNTFCETDEFASIHECGHLVAGLFAGCHIESITLEGRARCLSEHLASDPEAGVIFAFGAPAATLKAFGTIQRGIEDIEEAVGLAVEYGLDAEELWQRTRDILEEYWLLVTLLATELTHRRTIDHETLMTIFEGNTHETVH